MSYQVGKLPVAKKSKPTYLYSVISITLVLFMLGILSCFFVFSKSSIQYLRENIEVTLVLKNNAKELEVLQFQKKLTNEKFVKSVRFISKDEAAKIMQKDFGEDMKLLDYNPLYASMLLHLNAAYVNQDSLAKIEKNMQSVPIVEEVFYIKGIVDVVNKNIRNISIALTLLALLLFVIALSLIDNTIKLTMFSHRFLIRSMQLVGATRWFIIKPFVMRSIINGLLAGVIAVIGLIGLLYYIQAKVTFIAFEQTGFVAIFVLVVLVGVLMSFLSTYLAVSKYLRLKLDDLY